MELAKKGPCQLAISVRFLTGLQHFAYLRTHLPPMFAYFKQYKIRLRVFA